MTIECIDKHILSLRCKAAELASKWQDKIKTGKWCDEQECALILSDWGLDILCRYKKALEETPSQNSIFTGVFYPFININLQEGETITLLINNLPVATQVVELSNLDANYNVMELLMKVSWNIEAYALSAQGTQYTQFPLVNESTPAEYTYWNIEMDCKINSIQVQFSSEPQYNGSLNVDQQGVCSGTYFCFTEEEICKLINNLHRVLTFKCNCC